MIKVKVSTTNKERKKNFTNMSKVHPHPPFLDSDFKLNLIYDVHGDNPWLCCCQIWNSNWKYKNLGPCDTQFLKLYDILKYLQ